MKKYRSIVMIVCCLLMAGVTTAAVRTVPSEVPQSVYDIASEEDSVHLRWKSLGNGITYQFQMARDSDFRQIIIDQKINRPEITIKQNLSSGMYYVRTRPVSINGQEGEFSSVQVLEISSILSPPRILAPEEIAEFRNQNDVEFVWSKVRRADSYHVVLARDHMFTRIVYENPRVTETSITIRNLDFGPHFFKIRCIAHDGTKGPFSDIRSFIVAPPPPLDIFENQPAGQ